MVTFTTSRGITLSAHACQNGAPMPRPLPIVTPGAGDFAEREDGRARRAIRRNVRRAKAAWLYS